MNWLHLRSEKDLQDVMNSSQPVLIFKHSPRCIISKMVKSAFEGDWKVDENECRTVLIDVIGDPRK